MPPLSPETATSPLAEAPSDRPTMNLEKWAQDGLALLFSDRKLDQSERQILRAFMEEVALRAQNGGIGQGGTPPAEASALPPSPAELNQNTEEFGTVEGATPVGDYES